MSLLFNWLPDFILVLWWFNLLLIVGWPFLTLTALRSNVSRYMRVIRISWRLSSLYKLLMILLLMSIHSHKRVWMIQVIFFICIRVVVIIHKCVSVLFHPHCYTYSVAFIILIFQNCISNGATTFKVNIISMQVIQFLSLKRRVISIYIWILHHAINTKPSCID